jgi:hypothetical protein
MVIFCKAPDQAGIDAHKCDLRNILNRARHENNSQSTNAVPHQPDKAQICPRREVEGCGLRAPRARLYLRRPRIPAGTPANPRVANTQPRLGNGSNPETELGCGPRERCRRAEAVNVN